LYAIENTISGRRELSVRWSRDSQIQFQRIAGYGPPP
jgi:hypothetical protein